ncbi:hypothetical protein AAFC00_006708 [Neodothiora populina]|uniref:DUF7703 domain-containing protein n=1 Tax=Neodothiora populina TaxID=2781224 RepID=A0ABR3PAW6_9PEZI
MASRNSTLVSPGNGIVGGYTGDNMNILRAMMSFTAIALYNSAEIIILIFFVFKKYSGTYFWSLLVTALAIPIYIVGAWGKLVSLFEHDLTPVTMTTLGWIVMVTGQSLVLWSRLHLITQNQKLLKMILYGILINTSLMCPSTAVLVFGANSSSSMKYVRGYEVMERIQMVAFTVQELLISGIYLWEINRLLKVVYEGRTRKIMWEIAAVNIAIIVADIALVSVEFADLYQIQITLKGMIYSIKLKLEFGVLSKLVKTVCTRKELSIEVSDESQNDKALPGLVPTFRSATSMSAGTSPTMVNSNASSSQGKRRDSDFSSDLTHIRSVGSSSGDFRGGGDVTAMEVLKDDYAHHHHYHPSHCHAEMPAQLHRWSSRASADSDFYPGRLV